MKVLQNCDIENGNKRRTNLQKTDKAKAKAEETTGKSEFEQFG